MISDKNQGLLKNSKGVNCELDIGVANNPQWSETKLEY
jgi:hypothetical protein